MGRVSRQALGWLVGATLVSSVANGPHAVAVAAWLGPFLWLRALHMLPVRTGAMLGGLFYSAATMVAARGMIPVPTWLYVLTAVAIGMGALVPYALQRSLSPRLPTTMIPLLLPTLATALEFIGGRVSPFGSFGAIAYTQMGCLTLLQLAALVGLPGITFLVYVPAALAHWLLDHQPLRPQVRMGLACTLLLFLGVWSFGQVKLRPSMPPTPSVSIAIVSSPHQERLSQLLAPAYTGGDPSAVDWSAALPQGTVVIRDLLQRSESAARAGARIIVWPETAAIVATEDEPALQKAAGHLAREQGVYLAVALGVVRHRQRPWPDSDGALDNKMILLDPQGNVVAQYRKSIPVPGPEAALLVPGGGAIPIVNTRYGRLAMAICFDLDFPHLLRRAAGADILLVAAQDWAGISSYHAEMSRLRAIEGGFAVVRATHFGRDLVVDAQGRVLSAQDDAAITAQTDRGLRAEVPTQGHATLYSRCGDVLGWLAVAAMLLMIGAALVRSARDRTRHINPSPETQRPCGTEAPHATRS